ncbi:MAG TPA: OsmC family protein [Longimicrobiales bacterium]|nr:OsmC family protein [Longimicrobiales bacterium]
MADVDVSLRWERRGLEFSAQGSAGREFPIDGNTATATSPVETLLIALASCMAADIVDIGGKMRLSIGSLDVHATGIRNPEPPRRYLSAHLVFTVGGVPAVDAPKLERALALSIEKYCSVMHSLRGDMEITTELVRMDSPAGVETA